MAWTKDLLALSEWAIQHQDLRHRFLYAERAEDLPFTPGICFSFETNIVLSIYEAAIAKGFKPGFTIAYEKPYPGLGGGNPKRSDLAFKEPGPGQNWGYVEVKNYGISGKSSIDVDIEKLRTIDVRSQRWILCYRVRPTQGRSMPLKTLLERNFGSELEIEHEGSVPTIEPDGYEGVCEILLSRVR